MEVIFRTILLLSATGSLLALPLLACRHLTRRAFGSTWQYYIWLCVLVVLLLPLRLPESLAAQLPAVPWTQVTELPAAPAQLPSPVQEQAPATTTQNTAPETARSFTPLLLLGCLWLGGALLFWGCGMLGYLRFSRLLCKSAQVPPEDLLRQLQRQQPSAGCIRFLQSDLLQSPLLTGLLRPTLYLPTGNINAENLHFVLLHELTHKRRLDLWYKHFAFFVQAIHWFNPLVHLVCREIQTDCEHSCDRAVSRKLSEQEQSDYMRSILHMLRPCPFKTKLSTAMAEDKKQIERRFLMIRSQKIISKPLAALSTLLAALLLGASLFTGAALASNQAPVRDFEVEIKSEAGPIPISGELLIYDDNYYFPLREILAGLGITDIRWNDGSISIHTLSKTHADNVVTPAGKTELRIGSQDWSYPEAGQQKQGKLCSPPLLRKGITYVPYDFFIELLRVQQLRDLSISVLRSNDPTDYYKKGEAVFVGTAAAQDAYYPKDASGKDILVKRIVVDEKGRALMVIPVEYQGEEVVNAAANKAKQIGNTSTSIINNIRFVDLPSGVIIQCANNTLQIAAAPIILRPLPNTAGGHYAYIPITLQLYSSLSGPQDSGL